MNEEVKAWRLSGKYLPAFMRDFHAQKDLFKALHEGVNVEGHAYVKDISWIAGHCYVIDIFLWWMARHGYVLRKATTKLDFDDIEATLKAANEKRMRQSAAALNDLLVRD